MKKLMIAFLLMGVMLFPFSGGAFEIDRAFVLTDDVLGTDHHWPGTQTFDDVVISGGTVYATLNTPSFNSDAYGVTTYQKQASVPLKGIAQGTAAGVIYRADYDVSGATIFALMQNKVAYFAGNVGIGTTSPGAKLHILEGTAYTPIIKFGGATAAVSDLRVSSNGNEAVLASNANIGAGGAFNKDAASTYNAYGIKLGGSDIRMIAGVSGNSNWANAQFTLLDSGNVGIGTVVLSLFTKALEFGTGTTGTPVGPGFVAYADTESGVTKMHAYDLSGTFASLSSFNPETGKAERTETNIYAGIKATWKDNGTVEYTSIPKINPEEAHKALFVKAYLADEKNATWEQCSQEEAISAVTKEVVTPITDKKFVKRFNGKSGKIDTVEDTYTLTEVKEIVADGFRIRNGYRVNETTGKFERKIKPSKAEAESKFSFDWTAWPKYIRQAWGK